ncbi:hypothetical protein BUALT_Bualt12G0007600 [Buddleja alternifolia]|uniref:DUF761 domain-containing protein n=1 Tax=Buddleja alternifolia TaxID=168488 RepID=A0AAV6WW26_9LAMI|nr:hypothetical protein BUALT_Bualt12G0007600 [Buddleja alternifolia]
MPGSSPLKTLNSLNIFSMKPSNSPNSSSSSLSSMKLKTLLQTFIFSHMYRVARALTKAKSFLLQLLKDIHFIHFLEFPLKKNKQKKLFFGSFRLHYNWCSSHATMPAADHAYCGSGWNSVITTPLDEKQDCSNELSRYLQWLEEEKGDHHEEFASNEIDRLADLFIANCHEKFRLEKVESYRRFQEMMARSV